MEKYDLNGNLVAVGYFVEDPNHVKRGDYKETELDRRKKCADMLLTSIDGNYYTLFLKKEVEIKGRGVKRYSGNVVAVTENVYDKLKAKYNILCDF